MTRQYGLLTDQDFLRVLRSVAEMAGAEDGGSRRRQLAADGVELVAGRYALLAVAQSQGPSAAFDPTTVCAVGWRDPSAVQRVLVAGGCKADRVLGPWLHRLASAPWFAEPRQELVDDREWFGSRCVQTVVQQLDAGRALCAGCRLEPPDRLLCLSIFLSRDDERRFEPSDLQRLELLMETAHRLRRQLDDAEPVDFDLTPRLRQTLQGLLAGKAEKDIAHDLGIRPPTVHHYVGELLHHFEVHSVRELMAALLTGRHD